MRDRKSDQHRVQAARGAGRPLSPNEVVHHMNEDKSDNTPSNLTVEGRGAHTAHHNRTRHLGRLRTALNMVKKREKLY